MSAEELAEYEAAFDDCRRAVIEALERMEDSEADESDSDESG